jgi:hypothetical protein
MNWLVVVLFATLAGDVYIFYEPKFETRDECMATLYNKEDQQRYIQKLVEEYKRAMPIQMVNCLQEDVINEILEKHGGDNVKKGTNT